MYQEEIIYSGQWGPGTGCPGKAVGAPSLEVGWGPGQPDLLDDNTALPWFYICPKDLVKTNMNLNTVHWLFLIILLYSY